MCSESEHTFTASQVPSKGFPHFLHQLSLSSLALTSRPFLGGLYPQRAGIPGDPRCTSGQGCDQAVILCCAAEPAGDWLSPYFSSWAGFVRRVLACLEEGTNGSVEVATEWKRKRGRPSPGSLQPVSLEPSHVQKHWSGRERAPITPLGNLNGMVDYSAPASPQVTRERVYKQRGTG